MDNTERAELLQMIDDKYLEEAVPPAPADGTAVFGAAGQNSLEVLPDHCPEQTRRLRAVPAKRRFARMLAAAAVCLVLAGALWAAARFGLRHKAGIHVPAQTLPQPARDPQGTEKIMDLYCAGICSVNGTVSAEEPRTVSIPWTEFPMLNPEELAPAREDLLSDQQPPEEDVYRIELFGSSGGTVTAPHWRLSCTDPSWEVSDTAFDLQGHLPLQDGVLIYGSVSAASSDQERSRWIRVYSRSGELRWSQKLREDDSRETIREVFERGDGSIAVIGQGEQDKLCYTLFSSDGECLLRQISGPVRGEIVKAIESGDGFLLCVCSDAWTARERSQILRLNGRGEIVSGFTIELPEQTVCVLRMTEYDGKLWFSGNLSAKDRQLGAGENLRDPKRNDEDLNAEMLRTTAAFLLCTDRELQPLYCRTVRGALGSSLSVKCDPTEKTEMLCWEIGCIGSTRYGLLANTGQWSVIVDGVLCQCLLTEDGDCSFGKTEQSAGAMFELSDGS